MVMIKTKMKGEVDVDVVSCSLLHSGSGSLFLPSPFGIHFTDFFVPSFFSFSFSLPGIDDSGNAKQIGEGW